VTESPNARDVDELRRRLDRLESRAAVDALMANYAFGSDRREIERLLAVFHADAVYAVGAPFGTSTGHAAIAATVRTMWSGAEETHHWITNVVVDELEGDHAMADAHALVYVRTAAGPEGFLSAAYRVACERRDGAWRVAEMTVRTDWQKRVGFADLLPG